jgi:hypothetical protein
MSDLLVLAIRRSSQLEEEALDLIEGIAGLRGFFGMLDAVAQPARDEPEADLLERLGRSTQLGDDVAALTTLGQHRLYGVHLSPGTLQPQTEVFDHLAGQFHGHSSFNILGDLVGSATPGQWENFTLGRIRPSHFG